MEATIDNGAVVLDFGEDDRRDVLIASEVARYAAEQLQRLAVMVIASKQDVPMDSGPSIDIECVLDGSKPLVRLVFGRWITLLRVSPARAIWLARELVRAATEVERRARWLELREPALLLR